MALQKLKKPTIMLEQGQIEADASLLLPHERFLVEKENKLPTRKFSLHRGVIVLPPFKCSHLIHVR